MEQLKTKIGHGWHSSRAALKHWWEEPVKQSPLFHSARVKLTGFYLAVIIALSLSLSLGTRAWAEYQFDTVSSSERGVVRRLLFGLYSVPIQTPSTFNDYQADQDAKVRDRLDDYVIIVNLAALVLGGLVSYWYAGRTLRPIEEAHEAQSRFAADASHELRTPLANLRIENEVFLRQKSFTPKEAKQLIESNLEEVQRLESLSSNLLALTQYGQTAIPLRPTSIASVIEAVLAQLDKVSRDKKIKFDIDAQPADVLANFDSLVQLVAIVLDNAIKYGPPGSHIYVHGRRQAGRYSLSIRDQGPGLTPSDLPHIFERLYRGDKARSSKVSGYGLGLSLAKEIARANRASIEANNYPSGGAVFTIVFTSGSRTA